MPVAHVNDTELFYVQTGAGLPCMVMHGGLGLDHTYLHPWLDPLGDVLHLTYYDHRGNGRSGRPPVATLTHEQYCADADALRSHLSFERMALLGHSYGGFLALEYVLRYPERVSHLLLIDTAPAMDYGEEVVAIALRKGATPEMLVALAAEPPAEDATLAEELQTVAPLYFYAFNAETVAKLLDSTIYSASTYAAQPALLARYNVVSRLHEIQTPTLIVVGGDDFITPPSQAQRLHQAIAGSELMVLERSGHFPYVEEPEAFFGAVRDWLGRSG
jgi:proline iminopeptidase